MYWLLDVWFDDSIGERMTHENGFRRKKQNIRKLKEGRETKKKLKQ